MSGPVLLPTWEQLGARPQIVDTMRRYLEQIACVLRPGSVAVSIWGCAPSLRSWSRPHPRSPHCAGHPPPHRELQALVGQTPRTEQGRG